MVKSIGLNTKIRTFKSTKIAKNTEKQIKEVNLSNAGHTVGMISVSALRHQCFLINDKSS